MVFARKYRPKALDEIIGQPTVVQTLTNSLLYKKLHHAYLFIGKFGCGKCVSPDAIVWTEQGLKRIKLLVPNRDGIHNIDCSVYDETGIGSASSGYYERNAHTVHIETREGFQIEATPEHPVRVWTAEGLVWKQAGEIKPDDWLPIVRNDYDLRDNEDMVDVPWIFDLEKYLEKFGNSESIQCKICSKHYGNLSTHLGTHGFSSEDYRAKYPGEPLSSGKSLRKNCLKSFQDIDLPSRVPIVFARLCGYILSEGGVSGKKVFVTNADPDVIKEVKEALSLFGMEPKVSLDKRTNNTVTVALSYIKIAEAWKNLGFGGNSYEKRVPDFILGCPPNWIREFLRAYFEGDGGIDGRSVSCSSRSLGLIRDVQTMLLYNGIISSICKSRKGATNGKNIKKDVYTLRIYGKELVVFAEKFGFISERKKEQLQILLDSVGGNPNKDVIPFVQDKIVRIKNKLPIANNGCFIQNDKSVIKLKWPGNVRIGFSQHKNVTYQNLRDCLSYFEKVVQYLLEEDPLALEVNEIIDELRSVIDFSYFYSPVVSIKKGSNDVIDISKDGEDHSFFANGMINHNTSTARILAASENCKVSPGSHPCGKCDLCKSVFTGTHADISEIDAASSAGKVDQIRELKQSASFTPIDGAKTKYYIVDEAHRMSAAAEEALLKILEEPPARVRFVLCTTESQQMRGTILSRCQVHEFKKIYWRQMEQNLENISKSESIEIDTEALNLCAKLADGSMRNALQNLEKLVDFAGGNKITATLAQGAFGTASDILFYRLIEQISKPGTPDATSGYKIINELLTTGMGASQIFDGISEVLRNILIGVSATACGDLITVSEEAKNRLKEQLKCFKPKIRALIVILQGLVEARTAVEYGQGLDVAVQMWFLDSILVYQKGG